MATTRRRKPVFSRARNLDWQLGEWARVMGVPLLAAQHRATFVAPGTDPHAGARLFAGRITKDLTPAGDDAIVAGHTVSTAARRAALTTEVHHMSTTTIDAPTTTRRGRGRKATTTKPDPKTMTPAEREAIAPAGLSGKARERFIATGETLREQTAAAKATRAQTAKAAKSAAASARAKAAGTRPPAQTRDGITAMQAAEKVLRKATGPMKVSELAAKAAKLPEFKPTGKTPEASVAARVHVSAKTPGGVFVRVERGVVDVRELNPRGSKNRPKAKA